MVRIWIFLFLESLITQSYCIGPYQNHFDKAQYFINNFQYLKCIEFIENSVIGGDEFSELNLLLSEAYLKNHEFNKADSLLVKWIKTNKNNSSLFKAYQLLIETKIASAQYDSGRHYLNLLNDKFEIEQQDSQLLASFYLVSGKLLFSQNRDTAYSFFRKSLINAKDSSSLLMDIHRTIGVRLVIDDLYDSGMYHINYGIELQKNHFTNDSISLIKLQLQKAYTFLKQRKIKESIDYYEKIIRPVVFVNHLENQKIYNFLKTEFYRLAIITYSFIHDYEKTITYSNAFLKEAPFFYRKDHFRFGEVYRDMAMAYLSMKKMDKYVENINKSVDILKNKKSYDNDILYYKMQKFWVLRNYDSCLYWSSKYLESVSFKNTGSYFEAKEIRLLSLIHNKEYEQCNNELQTILTQQSSELNSYMKTTFYSLYLYNIYRNKEVQEFSSTYSGINYLPQIDSLIDLTISQNKDERYYYEFLRLLNSRNLYQLKFQDSEGLYQNIKDCINLNCIDCIYEGETLVETKESRFPNEMFISNYLMAKHYLKMYSENNSNENLERALQYFDNCRIIESEIFETDINNKSINDKIVFAGFRTIIVDELVAVLYSLSKKYGKYHEQIFNILESKKESILTGNLRSKAIKQDLKLPDTVSLRIRSLEGQIEYLKRRIRSYPDYKNSRLVKNWEYNLQIAEQDLEILSFNSEIKSLRLKSLENENQNLIDLITASDHLTEKDLLIHYFKSQNNTYTLAISPDRTEFLKLSPLADSVVQQFRNSLDPATANSKAEENYQKYVQSAYAIYQSQLKPVLDKFPEAKKIYVIPDGQLHHIPFETLISELPAESPVNYKKLKYLINDYTFSYANSATTLFKTKSLLNRLKAPGQNILAFAPSYGSSNASITSGDIEKQPLSNLRGELMELQWNSEEVDNIKQKFEGNFLTNSQATEAQFKAQASKHDILHLSMHAVVDHEDPMYSYLAFAPDPNDTSSRDGFLHAFEIYDMDLNAEMAVLSACNTGYGKLYKGEGPMSLAKAFTYAGCPSVVMSHWPADDKSSSEIMGLFYQNLAEGMKKDEALRKAKLDFFASAPPFRQSPAYWNNFVVMGDVAPIVQNQTQLYIFVMLAVVAFFLLIWLVVRLVLKKRVSRTITA